MDGQRFDDLTKVLGAQRTRRGLIGALAGAAIGALGLSKAVDAHDCRSVGNICAANHDCCSGACVSVGRSRKICQCTSAAGCPGADQCHVAVCALGACGLQITHGGCSNGNLCTINATCQNDGSCAGIPVTCTVPNECFSPGACQPASGQCSAPVYHGDQVGCSTGVCHQNGCCTSEPKTTTCANGACGDRVNNCGQTVPCLLQAGGTCTLDGDCCSGVCVAGVCQAGPVTVGGTCDGNSDCASGHCCGSVCRDVTADPDNCGMCGKICSSNNMTTRTCDGGVCDGTCAGGFADCDTNKQTNGCETNVATDPDDCGFCGTICSGAHLQTRVCVAAICAGQCASGFGDCNGDKQPDGCKVDFSSDVNHCGDCTTVCLTGRSCQAGQCLCPSGQRLCGDQCILTAQCCVDADCSDGNLCTDDVCDPVAYSCSNPPTVCPVDPNHGGQPCWTTVCTDAAVGCQSVVVADGTNVPACGPLGSTPGAQFCYGGQCCLAGTGNYACFVDSACCPGYHCVCHNSDPEIGCGNNSGQCELCRTAGIACAQNHECCSESCVGSVCATG